jgi:hypothetical protein
MGGSETWPQASVYSLLSRDKHLVDGRACFVTKIEVQPHVRQVLLKITGMRSAEADEVRAVTIRVDFGSCRYVVSGAQCAERWERVHMVSSMTYTSCHLGTGPEIAPSSVIAEAVRYR